MRRAVPIIAIALAGLCATVSLAQDPAQTDPLHFKVEIDNPTVRVLHVTVAPNTKVKFHELAGAVVVPLTDYESILKRANGQTMTVTRRKGKAGWLDGGVREFQSGARGIDALLIEIKRASPPSQ